MTATTLKTDWLVRRHGSNAANQSMTPVKAVAIVTHATREEALGVANANVDCYANQHLEVVAFEDANGDEWNEVAQRDAELTACSEEGIVWTA